MKIDKNSIYFQAVLKSSLIFKIRGTAKALFNHWIEHANQHYPCTSLPDDESLFNDLVSALAKGLELVWRNENQIKRNKPNWAVNCVLDVVSTSLNTIWYKEFVYKATPEYKELTLLKALSQYFKLDTIALKKIEALYIHMNKNLTTEISINQCEKIIDINQFKKSKNAHPIFETTLINYLESIYYEKHFSVFGEILKHKYHFVLTDFFNPDDIEQLIKNANSHEGPSS